LKRASLFLLPLACVGVALALPPAAFVTPPAPSAWVTDEAGLLAPDARDRIAARLKKIKESSSFLRIYVYALKSAKGLPVTDAMQELYHRWRMRERESGDGLATIFLFGEERSARVMLRPAASPRLEEAMSDIGRDLSAVFPKGVEPPDEATLFRGHRRTRHRSPRRGDVARRAADSISELFRKGNFTGGLRHGIETVGRALAEHYPKRAGE
jgi:uncharacterized membrane protein YgcG